MHYTFFQRNRMHSYAGEDTQTEYESEHTDGEETESEGSALGESTDESVDMSEVSSSGARDMDQMYDIVAQGKRGLILEEAVQRSDLHETRAVGAIARWAKCDVRMMRGRRALLMR